MLGRTSRFGMPLSEEHGSTFKSLRSLVVREISITFSLALKLIENLSNTDALTLISDLLYLRIDLTWCSLDLGSPQKQLSIDTTCAQIQYLEVVQQMLGIFRPGELSITLQIRKCSRDMSYEKHLNFLYRFRPPSKFVLTLSFDGLGHPSRTFYLESPPHESLSPFSPGSISLYFSRFKL